MRTTADIGAYSELMDGARRFIRRHPLLSIAASVVVGAAAYALIHPPTPPQRVQTRTSSSRGRILPSIPPSPAAIAEHERLVRVWAYHVRQGLPMAHVPPGLSDDVERYLHAGGRVPAASADGALPFDW